ncbi:Exocyst complex component EXO70E2 [Camellia lanceoleosa]|uniref:Exocyst complex component EXO70E2 n=1 Tax=Camellia lanceoleosa TaxID=1840588 RepID=A0ACC0HX65_9ERIC|nr:Exocyst complex component EXO70E2 [Camellia lanceoleosa]
MNYERSDMEFNPVLAKGRGIYNPGSNSISKTLLKERLQSFYVSFEEVYKSQTGWLIPDGQLREDLRISTSLKVIQAYRTFVGRYTNYLSDKLIKYSADDLEKYLLDLFEGSPRSLHNFHRK